MAVLLPAVIPGHHCHRAHTDGREERDIHVHDEVRDPNAGNGQILQLAGKIGVHRAQQGLEDVFHDNGRRQLTDGGKVFSGFGSHDRFTS